MPHSIHPFQSSRKPTDMGSLIGNEQVSNTTFLITNLHCPTCVSVIENAFKSLKPELLSMSPSIITHSIIVRHEVALSTASIAKALENAGYEVYGIFQGSSPDSGLDRKLLKEKFGDDWTQRFESAVENWNGGGKTAKQEDSKERKRHIDQCGQCRAEAQSYEANAPLLDGAGRDGKTTPLKPNETKITETKHACSKNDTKSEPFIVIDNLRERDVFRATIAIEGMTCSSCVGNITRVLDQKSWVRSANVTLLTNSASVIFEGREHINEIVAAIEDVGYGANMEQVEDITPEEKAHTIKSSDTWQVSYAVGGMTCSSCVGNITKALQQHGWIETADVNLISNSATVTFHGKDNLAQIQETIEDVGYTATLDNVLQKGQAIVEDAPREVSIRVNGMYCDHCPRRIVDALIEQFGEKVRLEKELTISDPILNIGYFPQAPDFTIRDIVASISMVDKAFQSSIYHPPTLEERSREMQKRERRYVLLRLGLSVIAAIPTLVVGIVLMSLVSAENRSRKYIMEPMWAGQVSRAEWAMFIISTPVYFFAADAFHRPALKELRALWRPSSSAPILQRFYRFGSMNMLMSLGTTIAYFSSIANLATSASQPATGNAMRATSSYFDSVVFLTMFLLFGRFLEAYSKAKTGDAVTLLGKLRPTEAVLINRYEEAVTEGQNGYFEEQPQRVPIDLLEVGDEIKVLHGGSPPSDGTITKGESMFDESSLTGESKLVKKSVGDNAFSGTINQGGTISIRISSISGTSILDQIVKVVREGQTRRAPIERVADIITGHFVPVVVLIAVSTWIVWLSLGLSGTLPLEYLDTSTGGWASWSLQFAIAVFVIACPCGIGLAAPTALFVGGGLAANHGILAKGGGEAFQEASSLDCIVFDKTGTLTVGGEPAITDHIFQTECDEQRLLGMVKSLEVDSSHPVAKAMVYFCEAREFYRMEATKVEEIPGRGIKGSFKSSAGEGLLDQVIIGNEAFMADYSVEIPDATTKELNAWKTQGKSVALLARSTTSSNTDPSNPSAWTFAATFAVADPLRPNASAVCRAIQRRGIQVWMLSGDNPTTARAVAQMVGIPTDQVIAGVLPDQKAEKIQYLQKSLSKKPNSASLFGAKAQNASQRAIVAMIGDGINDSPALTMADVGIAIGSGSDIAISSADFVLLSSNLGSVLTLIDLSRTVFRRVKFNFLWALVYNLLALPIAAGVLYPIKSGGRHVRLDPVWASLAMALSSVSVVCSSLLLKSGWWGVGFRGREEYGGDQ